EVPGPCGRKGVRREHDRGPRAEREVQSAEPVGEEELRGRVRDVIGSQVEDVTPVARDRMEDAPLPVHHTLRAAGGPRAVEPEGGIVRMRRERSGDGSSASIARQRLPERAGPTVRIAGRSVAGASAAATVSVVITARARVSRTKGM